jgi:hypothetical protein
MIIAAAIIFAVIFAIIIAIIAVITVAKAIMMICAFGGRGRCCRLMGVGR